MSLKERKTMQIDLKTPREILRRRERISTTNSLYPCKTSTGNLKMNMVASSKFIFFSEFFHNFNNKLIFQKKKKKMQNLNQHH